MLFGSGRNVVAETVELFRENAEAAGQRSAEAQGAALAQFAAEFAHPRLTWFDRLIDGLNRLPRPLMAYGVLGLFVAAMTDPVWFASRMQGLALVPEPLWWLMGAIVSFYFGARYQSRSQDFQRSIAETIARAPQVTRDISALGDPQAAQTTREPLDEPEDAFGAGDNPSALPTGRRAAPPDPPATVTLWRARAAGARAASAAITGPWSPSTDISPRSGLRAVALAGGGAADRRAQGLARLDGGGRACGGQSGAARGRRLRGADPRLRHVGFLAAPRGRELPFGQAAAVQDQRRLGQPRRVDAAVGADPDAVRRGGGAAWRQPARDLAGPGAGGAGDGLCRLLRLHPLHLEPVRAAGVRRSTGRT